MRSGCSWPKRTRASRCTNWSTSCCCRRWAGANFRCGITRPSGYFRSRRGVDQAGSRLASLTRCQRRWIAGKADIGPGVARPRLRPAAGRCRRRPSPRARRAARDPFSSTTPWKSRMSNLRAQRLLRPVAKLEKLELADHVAGRLARVVEIALDFLGRVALGNQRVGPEIVDCLLAAPALGMDARVDDQPNRAPQLRRIHAELGIWVVVEAHLPAQPFRIQPPAFAISDVDPNRRNFGTFGSSCASAIWKWWPGAPSW